MTDDERRRVLRAVFIMFGLAVGLIAFSGITAFMSEPLVTWPSWLPRRAVLSILGPLLGLDVLAIIYLGIYVMIQEFRDFHSAQDRIADSVQSTSDGLQELRTVLDRIRQRFGPEVVPRPTPPAALLDDDDSEPGDDATFGGRPVR